MFKNKVSKAAILLVVGVVITMLYFMAKNFLAVDKCLDSGGRFNYEQKGCEY